MSDYEGLLNDLKSPDIFVRDDACSSLCAKLILEEGEAELRRRVAVEIRGVYANVGPAARCIALDILSGEWSESDFYQLVRDDLEYSYVQFRAAHAYLYKILNFIRDGDSRVDLGEYFDFNKQMDVAFNILKKSSSSVVSQK